MSAWQLCLDIFQAEGIIRENSVFLNDFCGSDASYYFGLTPPQSTRTVFSLELYLLTGLKNYLLLAALQDMSMENTSYPWCSSTELIQLFLELQAVFIVISHITHINHDLLGKQAADKYVGEEYKNTVTPSA